jgi:hypothetical protein
MLVFYDEELLALPQPGGPPLIGCPQILTQYIIDTLHIWRLSPSTYNMEEILTIYLSKGSCRSHVSN